ncbi:MAG: ATP-binding protein [Eubacteriales bacterium]|nr:ATP-binding protein [Eubacteriales bacterium]
MELIDVRIEGFKNIGSEFLSLSGINALVALNAYGKSNILDAIDYACEFITSDKEEKAALMANSFVIPVNKTIQSRNFKVDFNFKISTKRDTYVVNYGYEFVWINKESTGQCIVSEWMKAKTMSDPKFTKLIDRSKDKALYRSSESGRCSNSINIDKNNLLINKLQAYDELYYQDIISAINSVSVYVERHLETTMYYKPDPIIRKDFEALDIRSIENIPRTCFYLKKEYHDKFKILIDAYIQIFPQIEHIDVEEIDFSKRKSSSVVPDDAPFIISDKFYRMRVVDKNLNQPINFSMLSDGCKRVFLMLTFATIADIKNLSLIAIEEPENSVHPALLQSYLRVLAQLANSCKIIVASHSPYILECIPARNIYVGIPNENNVTDFRKVASSKIKTLIKDSGEYSSSLGSYIFELLSGSTEDIKQLAGYLEK